MGYQAGYSNNTGAFNSFIGVSAGRSNTTGASNTFVGNRAGINNTQGNSNVFVGEDAGKNNTSGFLNVFLGAYVGQNNTTGSGNVAMGYNAGTTNTTGGFNSFIGFFAGLNNTTGSNNAFLGLSTGVANTTGSGNTFVGNGANAGSGNLTNATAIGNGAKVDMSNALVLGDNANIGIGTSSPTSKLHLTSGTANQAGLRLENLTSSSPATALNQTKFLTVDGSGNVILGSTSGSSARVAAEDALWERSGEFMRNTAGSVVIGEGVSKTPAGYSLYVGQGLLAEKVKVAIKNTDDWSDKVFAPGYRLAPLGEVAQYIQQHQHLPGIASAEEVVKEGIDVAQMNAKLLEKIEELTLYVVTLHKEVEELRQQRTQPAKKRNALRRK